MRTSSSSSIARPRASFLESFSDSVIWRPTGITGFSAVSASWKTIATSRPGRGGRAWSR
jgi:hypothetical protein